MAKVQLAQVPPFENRGFTISRDNVLLELHRLLAIFLASESFASLLELPPGEGFDPIYKIQEVEEEEISRLLLTLAIHGRAVDDRHKELRRQYKSEENSVSKGGVDLVCGELLKDVRSKSLKVDLVLREAFNKIIHAKSVSCDIENFGQTDQHVNPIVYLEGYLAGKNWEATVDVVKFAKAYVQHQFQDF